MKTSSIAAEGTRTRHELVELVAEVLQVAGIGVATHPCHNHVPNEGVLLLELAALDVVAQLQTLQLCAQPVHLAVEVADRHFIAVAQQAVLLAAQLRLLHVLFGPVHFRHAATLRQFVLEPLQFLGGSSPEESELADFPDQEGVGDGTKIALADVFGDDADAGIVGRLAVGNGSLEDQRLEPSVFLHHFVADPLDLLRMLGIGGASRKRTYQPILLLQLLAHLQQLPAEPLHFVEILRGAHSLQRGCVHLHCLVISSQHWQISLYTIRSCALGLRAEARIH